MYKSKCFLCARASEDCSLVLLGDVAERVMVWGHFGGNYLPVPVVSVYVISIQDDNLHIYL